ncbi:unnamed protein product [Caenorhabditis auriculariae]|uniref:Cell division cycle protein 27 homolog n=1 Tax=Caenorhabditis auriculariae TaxID=2777116 RepID=A0A8S1GMD1_9PELO|nr:unnamed protein product [Caenorhabditis auriculariae]
MAPCEFSAPYVEPASTDVEVRIKELLDYYAVEDALLLAEVYHLKVRSEESLLVYTDCLMRANRAEEVFGLLYPKSLENPRIRYVFAKCCFQLNKLEECQTALVDAQTGSMFESLVNSPAAPYAHVLLATLLCDTGRVEEAKEECKKCVKINVLFWSGVNNYITYGGRKLERLIRKQKENVMTGCASEFSDEEEDTAEEDGPYDDEDDSFSNPEPLKSSVDTKVRRSLRSHTSKSNATPAAAPARKAVRPVDKRTPASSVVPSQPVAPRKPRSSEAEPRSMATRAASQRLMFNSDTENFNGAAVRSRAGAAGTRNASRVDRSQNVRSTTKTDSSRLTSSRKVTKPLSSRNSNLARSLSGSANSVSSISSNAKITDEKDRGKEKALEIGQVAAEDEKKRLTEEEEAQKKIVVPIYSKVYRNIFKIISSLAMIEAAAARYNWKAVARIFQKLDRSVLKELPLARLMHARACFEQCEYSEAKELLLALHKEQPYRVEGMELLSTALWHLQDSQTLSTLAQALTTESRDRPQSWCAAGNCFSLQRQHTQAIECMERALQLDSRFAYAHTLLGHELIVQEELDRAASAFRSALTLAPRDYRALHGLGLVHLKKEQNALAQCNMAKAVRINPTNRAMLCTLSQVEMMLKKPQRAMELVDRALSLKPTDVASRFNRARLLFEGKHNEECLAELEKLKASSPDEAFVFHLLAKVHRRLGNPHQALLNFSWAAELDPRGDQGVSGTVATQMREEYEDDEYSSS